MPVLLTILSVLALWALLGVLLLGLLLILKQLQSVRGYLERIAMGVRAIAWHAPALGPGLDGLDRAVRETRPAADAAAAGLADLVGRLDAVLPGRRRGT